MTDPRPTTLGPLAAPPPPRSVGRWVALGCTAAIVACLVLALGIVAFVFGTIRRSGAYQLAVSQVRESAAVREALGEPVEEGWWVTGSVNVTGPSGKASLSFPVSGPRGEATVYVDAVKQAGEWDLRLLEVSLAKGGERLNLLDDAGASFKAISAFLTAAAAGDAATAHGCFSVGLKEALPLEKLASDVSAHADLFRTRELRLVKGRGDGGPRYKGTVVLESGPEVPASFDLVREGGEWRLSHFKIGS